MSVSTEIQRLQQAKADIKTATENKGVEVGSGTIDTYAEKIDKISAGGGDYEQGYADGSFLWQRVRDFNGIFRDAEFPENTDLVLDISNDRALIDNTEHLRVYGLDRAFQSAKGFNSIKIVTTAKFPFNLNFAFYNCEVKMIDLGDNPLINRMDSAFESNPYIKEIIGELDCSGCSYPIHVANAFRYCPNLETVRFKANTISFSITFANSKKLTAESIQSIMDGLSVVETAQTLTLNENVKILQSQVDSANAKGWTVVGGIVVSEEEYYE